MTGGHGKSSAALHGYRYEDHASDVLGLIRNLRLAAPILLGHSMGGMTAALVASQVGDAIRGLILADPTFLTPERQREVWGSDVAQQHRRLLGLDKDQIVAESRARHPHRSPEILDLMAEARLQTRMSAFDVLTPPNPDCRRLLSAVRIPVVLVIAENGVVSPETARELRNLNPRIQVELIRDAGHGAPYDQPERFEAIVRSFLRSLAVS